MENLVQHPYFLPTAISLGILIGFWIFWVLFLKFTNKYIPRLESWVDGHSLTLRFRHIEILSQSWISDALKSSFKFFQFWSLILVGAVSLTTIISLFLPESQIWNRAMDLVATELKDVFGAIFEYIPKLVFIVVVYYVTRFILQILRIFFGEIENSNLKFKGFYPEWARPTFQLTRVLVLIFAFIIVFPHLPGSGSQAFNNIAVFVGILVSLGSASAVSNLISGIVLTYMRPYRLGDRVQLGSCVGDVVQKDLLVTRIRTIKNEEITLPNSNVLGGPILNYSTHCTSEGLILHTTVTIGYDTPWERVHDALLEAARRTPLILKDPVPFVWQTALNDFHITYEINAYTRHSQQMAGIYADLHRHIQDSFSERGIEILSPAYTSIRNGNRTTTPSVPPEKRDLVPFPFRSV